MNRLILFWFALNQHLSHSGALGHPWTGNATGLGCQGPNAGPCGPVSSRMDGCTGPCCAHSVGRYCQSFCGPPGCIHGSHCGVAGSYYSCGHGCVGGCTGGVCASCCGPACN